jgi:hypothetical protein
MMQQTALGDGGRIGDRLQGEAGETFINGASRRMIQEGSPHVVWLFLASVSFRHGL